MKIAELFSKTRRAGGEERREDFAERCAVLTERLADIRTNFDFVTEQAIIDALIYEENATLCCLEQLYREARAEGVTVEIHERKK